MRVRPITPTGLVNELADRIAGARPGSWARVALDGAPPARPGDLGDALVAPLRLRGRDVVRVSASAFLRQASLRLEYGRTDPDSFHDDWFDFGALEREVLGPLAPGGSGQVLTVLRDVRSDRAARLPYVPVPPGAVLLLDGGLLLGRGLPFDLTVHLWLSPGALDRRLDDDERWTLPAYARYEHDTQPVDAADIVVKMDDLEHPALVETA
ncbi:uridine kinase [Spongiactinospora sp. TRM90649]|uniref:uridine kinase n=1 Tax=Spongiactinospora sp. TRM90649 TaxID=3031114 RepID=UPI0023F7111E|nr:uridine kinase [Spongiactinospora sp. TRM90649]MDF5759137.1 uridine kinase [Spongiactinospora sp. TRM90649]